MDAAAAARCCALPLPNVALSVAGWTARVRTRSFVPEFGSKKFMTGKALHVGRSTTTHPPREGCYDHSARAGLVDGLVDELLKISKAGGSMVLSNSTLAEPIRQISGGMALLPSHSESVLRGILAVVSRPGTLEKPVLTDSVTQGRMMENLLLYRQTFVIRSYEVGADKTASIETLMNLFQETALNHVRLSGIEGDGFGTTKAMVRNGLIWVVNRMHVEVESYPAWGDIVEVDSWVASSGKNGMRRDWMLRDVKTGQILARATSTWVMMHQQTRRLSKMPDDVRAEISSFFLDRHAVPNEGSMKINKLQNDSALYVSSGLQARRSDLDMNQHVNNVKYIAWMMESVPAAYLENLEIKSITLEYRRECGQADVVQSLTNPEDMSPASAGSTQIVNGTRPAESVDPNFPYLSRSPNGVSMLRADTPRTLIQESDRLPRFTHLLKLQEGSAEIVRGRTVWKSKPRGNHFPSTHS
ncbi:fatty acyl-ACP thioesterase B [Marchantia polymorpha subsp. ruderalis]|uniref:Acyl-[acyl-carrier-protein] hydrolase n=1 Tax=Marchantia polymorpha TaxID=3197 RepID=A0A2R6XC95_MARPO|nr:hypothetical protein MARPO_0023s0057 [Marchantia polymorpha]BBN01865.1 hypothetical protein Mp_2g10910 [Marchantia polymorpha subsp. ruderalis]|eukprot:PTQ43727.1 hypothetical protein MARPO_0023s0057 [Marchantia polymorpha]